MKPNWIAVDWGTSNLRLCVVGADGEVIKSHISDRGMNTVEADEFETVLLSIIEPYLSDNSVMPVICCGMVGARQGWADAGYSTVPCNIPNCSNAVQPVCKDKRISVRILSGIKQLSPADVMRGEETQIAGFLSEHPDFDGVICLPGTHSKWVHISAEEVVSFQTFMTGELFALLSKQSILRHSVKATEFDQTSFETALSDVMSRPQVLASQLFSLRAGGLVGDQSAAQARSRLTGLLIGAELAGARPYWLGQNVVVIGADELSKTYQLALSAQGVEARCEDVSEMTLKGMARAYRDLA